MRRAADLQRHQPVVAADAVLDMDDEVALGEGRQLGEELVRAACACSAGRGQAVAEDVLLGDDGGIAGLETRARAAAPPGRVVRRQLAGSRPSVAMACCRSRPCSRSRWLRRSRLPAV